MNVPSRRNSALALGSGLAGAGLVLLAFAALLVLWPMKANGVTGNALMPHYGAFGWYSYKPLPAHPTTADLRAAGIRVPQDVVTDRRREAAGVAALAIVVVAGGAFIVSRPESPTREGVPNPGLSAGPGAPVTE